jgi:hypothetical protein
MHRSGAGAQGLAAGGIGFWSEGEVSGDWAAAGGGWLLVAFSSSAAQVGQLAAASNAVASAIDRRRQQNRFIVMRVMLLTLSQDRAPFWRCRWFSSTL